MEADASPLHIVVFPWLAFGHMIPFLELSKRLAKRGHTISFIFTPRNISRLPPVPSHLSSLINLISLPLPKVEGLPEDAESTADVPPEKVELLKKAFDGLAAPFAAFLAAACAGEEHDEEGFKKKQKPDWIILDFCHHWLPPMANEHKVPCATFLVFPAAWLAFLGPQWVNADHPRVTPEHFMAPPKWIPFLSTLAYRRHEAEWVAGAFRGNASGVSDMHRFWQMEQRCRLIIYRSCHEVEPQLSPLLTDLYKKPAVPAGLLPPSYLEEEGDERDVDGIQWLDKQPPRSVIYVALGSEAPLSVELVHELALGLELSGVRFIWALRKPSGMFADGTGAMLPDGFEERTLGRGIVSMGWVPQMRVLAHVSVGAFLTHCGWGSIVESFQFDHPLVMLPFVVDQGLIARAMAEKKVGVEVPRDENDGSFNRDGVVKAVRLVMVEEEGKMFARNAKKLQEVLGDRGRHEKYVDDLAEYLRSHKEDCERNSDFY